MWKYERFILYPGLLFLIIYVLVGQPVMQAQPSTQVFERIEAQEIVLKNAHGVTVITLTSNEEEAGEVTTFNREGVRNAALRATDEGGGIATFNKENVMGAIVGATDDGGSIIAYNHEGVIGAAVGSTQEGGIIGTFNQLGELVVFLDQTDEGHGVIYVFDKYGGAPAIYGHE